jgi:hypothetical protein
MVVGNACEVENRNPDAGPPESRQVTPREGNAFEVPSVDANRQAIPRARTTGREILERFLIAIPPRLDVEASLSENARRR